ncbi:MAG: hypothetical protein R6U40_03875 [Desulfobacterales bacterium]
MNQGIVPGAVVTDKLLKQVELEWRDSKQGRKTAVERTARLGAILTCMAHFFLSNPKPLRFSERCVPPRMWELNHTPSWLNFHLKRDHHSLSTGLLKFCDAAECTLTRSFSGQTQGTGE